MRMCAGPIRWKTLANKKGEIRVVEDHSVDPLHPVELEISPPVTDYDRRFYQAVFTCLAALEWSRQWQEKRHLAVPLERQKKKLEEKQKELEVGKHDQDTIRTNT